MKSTANKQALLKSWRVAWTRRPRCLFDGTGERREFRFYLALSISILLIAFSPAARSQGLTFEPVTPTPAVAAEDPFSKLARTQGKPIPMKWKIAGILIAGAIASVALWIAVRVWRSSNLFDRQYRFPLVQSAALRLGANRSGGQVATITFRNRAGPGPASSAENR